MAEGGGERDPLIDHTDDRGDDDEGNETTGFEPGDPGASSTPDRRQTTMNRPRVQPSYTEIPDTPGLSRTSYAETELRKEFPNFNRMEIRARMDDNGRLEVGLIDPKKRYYRLITIQGKKGEYQINKSLPQEFIKYLGKSRRNFIEKEIKNLENGIKDSDALAI